MPAGPQEDVVAGAAVRRHRVVLMLRRLLLPIIALGLVPSAADARELTVELPRAITATKNFTVSWQGETGSNEARRGGFIVQAFLARGRAACPVQGYAGARSRPKTTLAAQNVFIAGPFRGAMQTYVPDSGRHRLCGYLTRSSDSIDYELLVDRVVRVRRKPARPRIRIARAKPGTYTASAASIAGGAPHSSLTVVISGGNVTSVAATGLRLSSCYGITPSDPQLNTLIDIASTGPLDSNSAAVRATSFSASLDGPEPDGSVSLHGGAASGREIRGVVTGTTADGNCEGGFAFTARR
jgi:hypothetical protein